MAHDPKLEIFKLILFEKESGKRKTFRELFRTKLNFKDNSSTITVKETFKAFHADFINKIDVKGYQKNEKKQKGFTIAFDQKNGERHSHISSPFDSKQVISGLLNGGKYGISRSLGDVDNTDQKTPIHNKNIVSDNFYFLIFAPLDHNEAIVMIQGYTESKISDVFKDHLLKYFRNDNGIQSRFEIFVPNTLKDKYLTGAKFKSVKFSSGWAVKSDFDSATPKDYSIEVKIEIIDKSKEKTNYDKFKGMIQEFGKSLFKLEGGKERKLIEFEKKNAKMVSGKKELSYDFDDENNVKPVILLKEEGITINEGQVPNFEQINLYCRNLLEQIIKETMPVHAIEEL